MRHPVQQGEMDEADSGAASRLHHVDLMDFLRDVWGGRFVLLSLMMLGIVLAILSVSLARPAYTATMLVGPPEQESNSGLGGALGRAAGAASLFGIGLGSLNSTTFTKYSSVLDSYELAAAILRHDELKTILFGPTWVPETHSWVRPTGFTFEAKEFVKGLMGMQQWTIPNVFTLHDKLDRMMTMTPDKQKGYLNISVTADTPQAAEILLKVMFKESDDLLRMATKERSRSRIKYLSGALSSLTLQDQRTAIIDALSSQEQKLMMASADPTVAVEVIDPPRADPYPSSPKPRATLTQYTIFSLFFGMLASVVFGLRWRQRARRAVLEGNVLTGPSTLDAAVGARLRRLFGRSPGASSAYGR